MPYCIYLRKSRADNEAEMRGEGETLARHEKALTAFAQQAGLEVTAIYKEIISGETIVARPMMQRLLSEVSSGMWDGVIVMDVDRLARGNSIDQGIISQTFLFANTKIITPAKTYDPSNEFDEEYFEFGLFMSRREYKTINRRLQRGRTASVREGKYVSNKAPYGYKRIKIEGDKGYTLAPVPEQAEMIKAIFEWYTTGILKTDGTRKIIGTALIARELNVRNIKGPSGNEWTQQTIRDILINPVYVGKLRWNWRPQKKKMINGAIVIERPRSTDFLLYNGLHPAIIDEQTFIAAAERMKKNKSKTIPNNKNTQNPFAGLFICAKCGRKMQRRTNPKTPDMLICPAPTCDNHAAYLHLVEKHLLGTLRKWANGYLIKDSQSSTTDNFDNDKNELSTLLIVEAKLNAQLNKAYEAFETEVYDAETFRKRSSAIKQKLADLTLKKQALHENLKKEKENQRIKAELIPKAEKAVETYYSLADATARNEMLKEIIDHIDYIKKTRGRGHEEEFILTVYPKIPKE